MTIDLSSLVPVVGFLAVWGVCYFITLILRFGSNLSWWSETIALAVSVVPSVVIFTDWINTQW